MTDLDIDSELLAYARPDEVLLPEKYVEPYRRNVAAITSVKKGMTVRDAARLHGVNRGTLTSIVALIDELAANRQPVDHLRQRN